MGACCQPRPPGALSIPRKHRSCQSHGLGHKQAGHEKYYVTQRWSSDDGYHLKGEPCPTLKLHPEHVQPKNKHLERLNSEQEEIPTKDSAYKVAEQHHYSALVSPNLSSALWFSVRLQIETQKQGQLLTAKCQQPVNHWAPQALCYPSISSSSTVHPQHSCTRDLPLLPLLATGHALGHKTENLLLPLVCIPQDTAPAYVKHFLPYLPISPQQPQLGFLVLCLLCAPTVRGQLCSQAQDPRDTSIPPSLARGGEASADLSATQYALQLWQGSGRLSVVPAAAVQLYP